MTKRKKKKKDDDDKAMIITKIMKTSLLDNQFGKT